MIVRVRESAATAFVVAAFVVLAPVGASADAPLSVVEARKLVGAGNLDDLFIAWSRLKKGAHPDGDKPVAQVLVDASTAALAKNDAPMAVEFAEKARKLDPASTDACFAAAAALVALDQRGAAEDAMDAAVALAPKDGEVLFKRAAFALEEAEFEKARDLFRRVPRGHPREAAAKAGLQRAQDELDTRARALDETVEYERSLEGKVARATRDVAGLRGRGTDPADTRTPARPDSGLGADENEVAGKTARESDHFRILYAAGARDFGERAEFEGKTLALFEKAWGIVSRAIGTGAARKVDVVLYTREEFTREYGGGGLLGFYSGKIRMNRSDNLDDGWLDTAVHEYVHAVVDDLSHGNEENVPIWMNEGLAAWVEGQHRGSGYASSLQRHAARDARDHGALPSLQVLARTPFGSLPSPTAGYAKSAAAIEYLVRRGGGGMSKLVQLIADLGAGGRFDDLAPRAFGSDVLDVLDAEATKLCTK